MPDDDTGHGRNDAATPLHAAVIGAGVGGLATALALSRRGHRVTIIERDATPTPADPDEAFWWDRRGAPQVRHSHALLARLRNLLRDRYPDVLDRLFAAGATEIRFCELMPPEIDDPSPRPGDEDLVALACRRTTFEWVLRSVVLEDPNVHLIDGATVEGLLVDRSAGGPPTVRGVRIRETSESLAATRADRAIAADLVVASTGRRSGAAHWLAEHDIELPITEEDTGIVYLSRFYRLLDGVAPPVQDGPIGADLGYLKYAIFQGDNRTHSITFAVRTGDDELRRRLLDPEAFNRAAGVLPATAQWAAADIAEPITPVHVMGGLLNRLIRFTDDTGSPLVLGFHAVGDAHTCTNPLYGRGCTLAAVQANLLADTIAAHPADPVARARAYEEASEAEIEPWYHAAVAQDRMARELAHREQAATESGGSAIGPDQAGQDGAPDQMMAEVLREGLMPAVRTDAVVFRAFIRAFNLLDRPDALLADADVIGRVLAVYNDRGKRSLEPPLGPSRSEMLASLAA